MVGTMSNILLTGAGGYLGAVLQQVNFPLRHTIYPLDLGIFTSPFPYPYNKIDLKTGTFKRIMFPEDASIDTVVHLAGISNDPSGEIDPAFTRRNNIDASKRLIDFALAAGVKKFIFASSASVYGENDALVTEESPLNPKTHYAESKAVVEEYLLGVKELNPTIFRFGTLFGVSPKMRFDIAINLMVKDGLTTKKINVYGGGEQYRPFLHVEDAAAALLLIAGQMPTSVYFSGQIYNLCSSNIRIGSLAEVVANLTESEVIFNPYDHPDIRNYRMDCSKFLNRFGMEFTSIVSGVLSLKKWVEYNTLVLDNRDYYTIEAWKKYMKHESTIL